MARHLLIFLATTIFISCSDKKIKLFGKVNYSVEPKGVNYPDTEAEIITTNLKKVNMSEIDFFSRLESSQMLYALSNLENRTNLIADTSKEEASKVGNRINENDLIKLYEKAELSFNSLRDKSDNIKMTDIGGNFTCELPDKKIIIIVKSGKAKQILNGKSYSKYKVVLLDNLGDKKELQIPISFDL